MPVECQNCSSWLPGADRAGKGRRLRRLESLFGMLDKIVTENSRQQLRSSRSIIESTDEPRHNLLDELGGVDLQGA